MSSGRGGVLDMAWSSNWIGAPIGATLRFRWLVVFSLSCLLASRVDASRSRVKGERVLFDSSLVGWRDKVRWFVPRGVCLYVISGHGDVLRWSDLSCASYRGLSASMFLYDNKSWFPVYNLSKGG